MSRVDVNVLATGSSGNAIIVQKNILIDCGVPFKMIEPYLDDIKLVLLTHVHADHFKPSTIRRMALEKPLLRFGCGAFLAKDVIDTGVKASQVDVLRSRVIYGYGICSVIPVDLVHDKPNYGYKIFLEDGRKVFYATDTCTLSGIIAKGYDLYLVENNYKEDELKARMDEKEATGAYAYERRVLKYHLSEQKCLDWLYKNMANKSEYVFLHQHVERNFDEG